MLLPKAFKFVVTLMTADALRVGNEMVMTLIEVKLLVGLDSEVLFELWGGGVNSGREKLVLDLVNLDAADGSRLEEPLARRGIGDFDI